MEREHGKYNLLSVPIQACTPPLNESWGTVCGVYVESIRCRQPGERQVAGLTGACLTGGAL